MNSTSTSGDSVADSPTSNPRRIRKLSEKRASVNRKPTAISRRVGRLSSRKPANKGARGGCSACATLFSLSASQASRKHSSAGITAIQNTVRMFPANSIISPTAAIGAIMAPTVSSDWRRP